MKLSGLIDDGEIFIESSLSYIAIKLCVYRSKDYYVNGHSSIKVTITIPPPRNDDDILEELGIFGEVEKPQEYRHVSFEEKEASENFKKAFLNGAAAVGGFLLSKLFKWGIKTMINGPLGAAVGYAC